MESFAIAEYKKWQIKQKVICKNSGESVIFENLGELLHMRAQNKIVKIIILNNETSIVIKLY